MQPSENISKESLNFGDSESIVKLNLQRRKLLKTKGREGKLNWRSIRVESFKTLGRALVERALLFLDHVPTRSKQNQMDKITAKAVFNDRIYHSWKIITARTGKAKGSEPALGKEEQLLEHLSGLYDAAITQETEEDRKIEQEIRPELSVGTKNLEAGAKQVLAAVGNQDNMKGILKKIGNVVKECLGKVENQGVVGTVIGAAHEIFDDPEKIARLEKNDARKELVNANLQRRVTKARISQDDARNEIRNRLKELQEEIVGGIEGSSNLFLLQAEKLKLEAMLNKMS